MDQHPPKRDGSSSHAHDFRIVSKPPRKQRRSFKTASRGTVGRVALRNGSSLAHASSLERRWILFIDSDPATTEVRYEPFTLDYLTSMGVRRPYTPDIFATSVRPGTGLATVIYEVKESADLATNGQQYAERFAACDAYCRQQGWTFRVVTELDLPHPRLENVMWLRRYRLDEHDPALLGSLIDQVRTMEQATMQALLADLASKEARAITRAAIWHLIAARRLRIDLDQPMTDTSVLSLEP